MSSKRIQIPFSRRSAVVLDMHLYLMNAESEGCEQTIEAYIDYTKTHFEKDITEMEEYFPVICGELFCITTFLQKIY